MIKSVKQPVVWPRVCSRVETVFSGGVGMNFSNEREGPIKMGVPGNRTNSEYAGGRQRSARDG